MAHCVQGRLVLDLGDAGGVAQPYPTPGCICCCAAASAAGVSCGPQPVGVGSPEQKGMSHVPSPSRTVLSRAGRAAVPWQELHPSLGKLRFFCQPQFTTSLYHTYLQVQIWKVLNEGNRIEERKPQGPFATPGWAVSFVKCSSILCAF